MLFDLLVIELTSIGFSYMKPKTFSCVALQMESILFVFVVSVPYYSDILQIKIESWE